MFLGGRKHKFISSRGVFWSELKLYQDEMHKSVCQMVEGIKGELKTNVQSCLDSYIIFQSSAEWLGNKFIENGHGNK